MKRAPIVCLWFSLIYLVAAFVFTSTSCFVVLLQLHGSILQYYTLDPAVKEWISSELNLIFHWFWAMCVSVGIGILLVAVSALWVSVSRGSTVVVPTVPLPPPAEAV